MSNWRTITNDKSKYQAYLCSREWSVLKRKVRDRSGGRCERCRVNPHESTHHLTYERKYNERLEDLQGICNKCHAFIHGKSDFDPAAWPPVVNGKVAETFYLAGKITGTTWRDSIVPGWSYQNSRSFSRGVNVIGGDTFNVEWMPVDIQVPLLNSSKISYMGPWWCDPLCHYGGHGSCVAMNGPHACVDDSFGDCHGFIDVDDTIAFRDGTRSLVFDAIKHSDIVFAWVDSADCHGTLLEVGVAAALKKTLVFATPHWFEDMHELWLAGSFANYRVFADTPQEAWLAFWGCDGLEEEIHHPCEQREIKTGLGRSHA